MLAKQGIKVDLVCSGINHGANLGRDVLYSGTISAAKEGAFHGVQSVAFSVCDHNPTHFEAFQALIPSVLEQVYGKFDPSIIVSVNVPNRAAGEIKGLKITTTAPDCKYSPAYIIHEAENGVTRVDVDIDIKQDWDTERDDDISWIVKGYAVVAPVQLGTATDEGLGELRKIYFRYE